MNGNKARALRKLTQQIAESSENKDLLSKRRTYKNLKNNYKIEMSTINQKN